MEVRSLVSAPPDPRPPQLSCPEPRPLQTASPRLTTASPSLSPCPSDYRVSAMEVRSLVSAPPDPRPPQLSCPEPRPLQTASPRLTTASPSLSPCPSDYRVSAMEVRSLVSAPPDPRPPQLSCPEPRPLQTASPRLTTASPSLSPCPSDYRVSAMEVRSLVSAPPDPRPPQLSCPEPRPLQTASPRLTTASPSLSPCPSDYRVSAMEVRSLVSAPPDPRPPQLSCPEPRPLQTASPRLTPASPSLSPCPSDYRVSAMEVRSLVSAPPDPRPPQLSCPEPRPLQTASPRLTTASPSLSPCPSDYRVSAMEVRSLVSAPPDPRPPQLSCPEPRPLQTASPRLTTASPSLSPCPSDYRVSAMEVRSLVSAPPDPRPPQLSCPEPRPLQTASPRLTTASPSLSPCPSDYRVSAMEVRSLVSAPPDPRPPQLSCPEPRPLQTASPRLTTASPSLSPCPSDYRVSAMEVRRAPGRITDFVPESERSASSEASGSLRRHSPGLYTREQDLVMDQLATEHKAPPLVDVGQSPTPPSSQALSPASPPLSGTGDEEAAYSHVKRDIVFAKEPLPWQNGGDSPGRSVDESREQLGLLSLAARNPPPPPPHRDPANCADSERHNCADGRQHHPMPSFRHRDTHEHWLVQEADDRQRITEKVPEGQKASPQARPPSVDQPPAPTSPGAAGGPLLSVSGRQNCTHCGQELGRGAAMIIESLHLFYHLECFMCCVCGASLGSGSSGADVRVRRGKLHCHSCYSNDEAGLQLSQV